jgi:hypothetical protein
MDSDSDSERSENIVSGDESEISMLGLTACEIGKLSRVVSEVAKFRGFESEEVASTKIVESIDIDDESTDGDSFPDVSDDATTIELETETDGEMKIDCVSDVSDEDNAIESERETDGERMFDSTSDGAEEDIAIESETETDGERIVDSVSGVVDEDSVFE